MPSGLSVVIVQFGEDVPGDQGYAPLRYGRLAEHLTRRGHRVVRISPSFSHAQRIQRSLDVPDSVEGRHVIVPTSGYQSSVGKDRAVFIRQLLSGMSSYLRAERDSIDVVFVGVPPTGITTAARLAIGPKKTLIADVRDLWPDAFAVGEREKWMPAAKLGGRILSQELRLATTTTAVTVPMLNWVPKRKQGEVVPIGMRECAVLDELAPAPTSPLAVCFLSGHSHGFLFRPVLEGWNRYVADLGNDYAEGDGPRFSFIGAAPSDEGALGLAEAEATVELVDRVPADQVAVLLNGMDIGTYPSLDSWAYTLGNKVFDYLSSGLFMLHSIVPEVATSIDDIALGQRLALDPDDWYKAFAGLHERRVELRSERTKRIETAEARFGIAATTGRLCDLIESQVR